VTKTFLPLVSAGQEAPKRPRYSVCSHRALAPHEINVATYNIGASDKWLTTTAYERINRIMRQVTVDRGAEIVALQEVLLRLPVRNEVPALKDLYPKWSMYVVLHNKQQDYMNVIMSVYPFVTASGQTHVIESRKGYPDRTNLTVLVNTPLGLLRVFNVHTRYDEAAYGVAQTMKWVLEVVKAEAYPFVIMGDFNAGHGDVMDEAEGAGLQLQSLKASRIDHVFAGGRLGVVEAGSVPRPVVEGEHDPVFATVSF
jgi:endonuclease/exonuclease/phosphatase family metal-dependent hydrolase